MFSCDYNGWADVPEEEREAADAFEVEKNAAAVRAPGSSPSSHGCSHLRRDLSVAPRSSR